MTRGGRRRRCPSATPPGPPCTRNSALPVPRPPPPRPRCLSFIPTYSARRRPAPGHGFPTKRPLICSQAFAERARLRGLVVFRCIIFQKHCIELLFTFDDVTSITKLNCHITITERVSGHRQRLCLLVILAAIICRLVVYELLS